MVGIPNPFAPETCDRCDHIATVFIYSSEDDTRSQALCTCCFKEDDEFVGEVLEMFARGIVQSLQEDEQAIRKAIAAPFN